MFREFCVAGNLKVMQGCTDGTEKLYVLPLTATARDAGGRAAVLKLDAEVKKSNVEFLN